MLDLMRRHASSWIIKVALFGIIVVFVFFFGWGGPGDVDKNFAAKVNGTVITYDQFYNMYESQVELMRSRFRGSMPPDLIEKMNLKKVVLEGMIDQLVLLQEAEKLGLTVTDDDLIHSIRSAPEFQNNGVFDPSIYRAYLSTVKLTPAVFEINKKQELMETQVARIIADSVKTDDKELETLWHFQNDKLALAKLLIKPVDTIEPKDIDSKELEAYFKSRIAKYEIPASVKIQYALFSWRDLAKNLNVADEEALAYYKSNPREFTIPEKRSVRHILLKTTANTKPEELEQIRQRADVIRKRIQDGEDFASIAKAESEDETSKLNGGDLGIIVAGSMSPEFERAVSRLKLNEISGPVKTDQGFHIIRLDQIEDESQQSYEASRQGIIDKLIEGRARKQIVTDSENFYESVYRMENLADNARKFGFELQVAENVLKESGLPFMQNDSKITEEIFQLSPGEISRLYRVGDDFAVIQVLEKSKERIPELNEVRQMVEKDYAQHQALLVATKKAESLIEELTRNPQDSETIAKRNKLEWTNLDPTSRTSGFVPGLGKSAIVSEMLTSLSVSAPVFGQPIVVSDGVAVVKLLKLERASDELFAKESTAFGAWVAEVRKTELLKGWIRSMREKSSVEINQKLM